MNLYPVSRDTYGGPHYVYHLAWIYTVVGEYEETFIQLEYLMSIAACDIISVPVLWMDPTWDELREHPEFQNLLE